MTIAAWIMLAVTWSVIICITGRLFWRVLTSRRPEDIDDTSDGILRKDA
jgi:hypothetical protein